MIRGLRCHCDEGKHRQEGRYYVSIIHPDGRSILALGPFYEHTDALAKVDAVRAFVPTVDRSAHEPWYAYGTCVAAPGDNRPGALNGRV